MYTTLLVWIVMQSIILCVRQEYVLDKDVSSYECVNNVTVDLIDQCNRKLRKGKACGPDNLCAEHLIYAHPSIVVHLK